jgi:thiol:disulfide interchange protein
VAVAQTTPPPAQPTAAPATAKEAPPKIYDETADARKDIAAALARAAKENKRVLIQWGANWCSWCHLLHNTLKSDRDLAKVMLYEYELVHADIGRWDKNLDLAQQYGADFKKHGVPFLTVLDASGKVVANQETGVFEVKPAAEGDKVEPAYLKPKVLEFLKANAASPLAADQVLAAGLARAKNDDKRVFLHFGAPWCVWCRRLEAWMAQPDVATVLAKDFVDVKIDTDRMTGGEALYKKMCEKPGGIPWIAFLSPDGKALATGDEPGKGNIGFPAADHEIAHFETMLKAARRHMTDSEAAGLLQSLKDAAAKTK